MKGVFRRGSPTLTRRMAAQFFLIQNRQGKTRLARYWVPLSEEQRKTLRVDVHRAVASRESKQLGNIVGYGEHVLVYRKYAGLYCTMCIEKSDNKMYFLEAIHLFVEVLDTFFGSVCELDIVFHFGNVYAALDEMILAGELEETSKRALLGRLEEFERLNA